MSPSSTRSIPISGSITFLNWSRTRSSVNTLSPLVITLVTSAPPHCKGTRQLFHFVQPPGVPHEHMLKMFEVCYTYVWLLSHLFHFIHCSSCVIHNILWITSRCADR